MIDSKALVYIDNDLALTYLGDEVDVLSNNQFPKLIFQEFLKQLKIPHLKIEVSKSLILIQDYPALLEQACEDIIFKSVLKKSINKTDLINYFLVCYVLKSEFNISNVFFDNALKSTLYFQAQMPFSSNSEIEIPFMVKNLIKEMSPNQIKQLMERFFILLGTQFNDKLLIYLTFIEAKYKFKLNKKAFIKSALNPLRLKQLNQTILKLN